MRDLASPLLPPDVVSALTGLSPRMLRRWEALGVLPRRPAPRSRRTTALLSCRTTALLYSWRDVERLQRATHLAKTLRVSPAEAERLLRQSAEVEPDRGWTVVRPRPRVRRAPRRVVPMGLLRSAGRGGR